MPASTHSERTKFADDLRTVVNNVFDDLGYTVRRGPALLSRPLDWYLYEFGTETVAGC
jgi:hypothetical protein